MAHPSTGDRERDRETTATRHRTSTSQHHHHRTISSTTLLLVLSLILAVLAVMLSLPARHSSSAILGGVQTTTAVEDPLGDHIGTSPGFWGYLTPKRSHSLVAREHAVTVREAEVARREAELLTGAPGGIIVCPPCAAPQIVEEIHETAPAIQVVHAAPPPPPAPTVTVAAPPPPPPPAEPTPPAWLNARIEDLVQRELKISEREKEIGGREETVGKRESDALKREAWINDQLFHITNEVTEEHIYEPRHVYADTRRPVPPNPPKVGTKPTPPRPHF